MSRSDSAFEETSTTNGEGPPQPPEDRRTELVARLEHVEGVNQRLRAKLERVHRARYRRGAAGLLALALIAGAGAVVFESARTLLVTLGATSLVTALLTTVLLRGRFLSATTSEAVYSALAANERRLTEELDLGGPSVYVPLAGEVTAETAVERVRLFVGTESRPLDSLPAPDELEPLLAVSESTGTHGVSLRPTGGGLLGEYLASTTDGLSDNPREAVQLLADALVEGFELVRQIESEVNPAEGRVVFTVVDSAYGDVTRFDHPVASFLACGLAASLSRPVRCETGVADEDGGFVIVCRWQTDDER